MLSNDIVIKVNNISKCYEIYKTPGLRLMQMFYPGKKKFHKEFWALKNISFELKKGECIGVIGRNGAGKSTLLQIITGVLQKTCGDVQVNGKIAALLELGSGFNPEFTGKENVYMNATILGLKKKEIDEKIQEIMDFADIGDFINQPVKIYSSGMMLRLAFAVQIVIEPDLLIVDEALAVGDAAFQFKCMSRIKRLIAKGTSVLFVSHDTQTIKAFCDKCLWLDKGEVIAYGEAGKLADDYEREIRKEIESTQKVNADVDSLADKSSDKWMKSDLSSNSASRYGTGQIKVVDVEIVDSNGNQILTVDFGQEVIIRLYLEVCEQNDNVAITYIIKDSKQIPLLGYGNYEKDDDLYNFKIGRYIVEFKTYLPLTSGIYSITTVISKPTIKNMAAVSFDYADNIVVFSVNPKKPNRIWTMMQLNNEYNIIKVE